MPPCIEDFISCNCSSVPPSCVPILSAIHVFRAFPFPSFLPSVANCRQTAGDFRQHRRGFRYRSAFRRAAPLPRTKLFRCASVAGTSVTGVDFRACRRPMATGSRSAPARCCDVTCRGTTVATTGGVCRTYTDGRRDGRW